jgi:hypothetical protein
MVPRTVQREGFQGVEVYLMEHDARCVGVFFRKDTFLENLKLLAGDDHEVLAVLPHVRSVKPVFRDFAFVTGVDCYLPQGLDTEPLFARLREIKSSFVYFGLLQTAICSCTKWRASSSGSSRRNWLSEPEPSKRISRSLVQSSSTSSTSLNSS